MGVRVSGASASVCGHHRALVVVCVGGVGVGASFGDGLHTTCISLSASHL